VRGASVGAVCIPLSSCAPLYPRAWWFQCHGIHFFQTKCMCVYACAWLLMSFVFHRLSTNRQSASILSSICLHVTTKISRHGRPTIPHHRMCYLRIPRTQIINHLAVLPHLLPDSPHRLPDLHLPDPQGAPAGPRVRQRGQHLQELQSHTHLCARYAAKDQSSQCCWIRVQIQRLRHGSSLFQHIRLLMLTVRRCSAGLHSLGELETKMDAPMMLGRPLAPWPGFLGRPHRGPCARFSARAVSSVPI